MDRSGKFARRFVDEWDHDEWDSDERSDERCSCGTRVPSCGLQKVLVRPECYKLEKVKQYRKKIVSPKYELRYFKNKVTKPAYAPTPIKTSSCCCSLIAKYNKN